MVYAATGLPVTPHDAILVVDDDTLHVTALRRALSTAGISNPLRIATDGKEGLHVLRTCRENREPRPALILLDLRMPRMSGIEFLEAKRFCEESVAVLPVVVLSTSSREADRLACYRLGASGYVIKPSESQDYVTMVRTLYAYWDLCELP